MRKKYRHKRQKPVFARLGKKSFPAALLSTAVSLILTLGLMPHVGWGIPTMSYSSGMCTIADENTTDDETFKSEKGFTDVLNSVQNENSSDKQTSTETPSCLSDKAASQDESSMDDAADKASQNSNDTLSWNVAATSSDSVCATLTENANKATYTLELSGKGSMKDFQTAKDAPWFEKFGSVIDTVLVGDEVTSLGSFSLGLENLEVVWGGNSLATIADNALTGACNLKAVDLTRCTLKSVSACSFGSDVESLNTKRIVYVKDKTSADIMRAFTSSAQMKTALAQTNDGIFDKATAFQGDVPAVPFKEGFSFLRWTTDSGFYHPFSGWKPMSDNVVFYAAFAKDEPQPTEPQKYKGHQGLDQRVTLLDSETLRGVLPQVFYYGSDSSHYDNRIQTPFDENEDIIFAFSIDRGGNANGGDGAYQCSFTLPFVSILDSDGKTVAEYKDGSGALKLRELVFDNTHGKTNGRAITAFCVGVDANVLPAGSYTLRFGKGLGANNGISFLGKNVDFQFRVEEKEQYSLRFKDIEGGVSVDGIDVSVDKPVDVEIPQSVDGKTVVAVADGAFQSNDKIRSLVLPSTIQHIGTYAFAGAKSLTSVKVLSKNESLPAWGTNVFDNISACVLYGYKDAATVKAQADNYEAITFAPLEDGLYINYKPIDSALGMPIELDASNSAAQITIMQNTKDVTNQYRGFVSNTQVLNHENSLSDRWSSFKAQANGTADVVIRAGDSSEFQKISFIVKGFPADASMAKTPLGNNSQGNGCTVALKNRGVVETILYDETLLWFDNYLVDAIDAENALFTLAIGGPGSAWDTTRWDWHDWVNNHLSGCIYLLDMNGKKIATIGHGLTWTSLTPDASVSFMVDPGIMKANETYTLVADKNLTGHNVAASLHKDVRWTFTTQKPCDIARAIESGEVVVKSIPNQIYTGEALEPEVNLSRKTPATKIWNPEAQETVTTPEGSRSLKAGVDYILAYANNKEVGQACVIVRGVGCYTGDFRASFAVVKEGTTDITSLQTAIEAAEKLAALPESVDGYEIADKALYVLPNASKELREEITKAKDVCSQPLSPSQVEEAAQNLENVCNEYRAHQVKTATVKRSALREEYTNAQNLKDSVVESKDGSDIGSDTLWATPESMIAFDKAIEDASCVLMQEDISQKDMDIACDSLKDAIALFKDSASPATGDASSAGQTSADGAAVNEIAAAKPDGQFSPIAKTGDSICFWHWLFAGGVALIALRWASRKMRSSY